MLSGKGSRYFYQRHGCKVKGDKRTNNPTALLRLKDNQWQVQWPEDSEFHNLTGWFATKTYKQTVENLKSLPLKASLKYKLVS